MDATTSPPERRAPARANAAPPAARRKVTALFASAPPLLDRRSLHATAITIAWTDLRRRPGVPLVAAGAIAICCMLLMVVSDLSIGLFAHQERALHAALPTRIVALTDVGDPAQRLTPQRLRALASLDGIARIVPRYERRARVQLDAGPVLDLPVDGTVAADPDHDAARMAWGRGLESDQEFAAVLPRALFDQLGGVPGAGARLHVTWTRVAGDGLEETLRATLPVVGVAAIAELPYPRVRVPMALAQRVDMWTRGIDDRLAGEVHATPSPWRGDGAAPAEINVHARSIDDVEPVATALRRLRFDVQSRAADVRALRDSAGALARFVGTLVIPVVGMAGLLILALQAVALAGRREETWLLCSLGVPARRITFGLHGLQGLIVGAAAFGLALLGFACFGASARSVLAAALSVPTDPAAAAAGLPAWLLVTSFGLSVGLATLGSIAPSAWMLRARERRIGRPAA